MRLWWEASLPSLIGHVFPRRQREWSFGRRQCIFVSCNITLSISVLLAGDVAIQRRVRETASRFRSHGVTVEIDRSYKPEVHVSGPGVWFFCSEEEAEGLLALAEMASFEWDVTVEEALLYVLDITRRRGGWASLKNVSVHLGQFGETFARQWLSSRGYEVRHALTLAVDLESVEGSYQLNKDEFLSEEQYRSRRMQSLADRIPVVEKKILSVETSMSASRHRRWVEKQRAHLDQLKRALNDLRAGKKLEDIDDPERGWGPSSLPWSIYRKNLHMKREEARTFLGPKSEDSLEYMRAKGELADFLAKRGGQYYIVEVKTNTSELTTGKEGWRMRLDSHTNKAEEVYRTSQKEGLHKAKEFGFNPMLVRVRLEADCREEPLT